jgi:hypothetical protein
MLSPTLSGRAQGGARDPRRALARPAPLSPAACVAACRTPNVQDNGHETLIHYMPLPCSSPKGLRLGTADGRCGNARSADVGSSSEAEARFPAGDLNLETRRVRTDGGARLEPRKEPMQRADPPEVGIISDCTVLGVGRSGSAAIGCTRMSVAGQPTRAASFRRRQLSPPPTTARQHILRSGAGLRPRAFSVSRKGVRRWTSDVGCRATRSRNGEQPD